MSFRAASLAITKSSHLMALYIIVSTSLLLSLPLVIRAAAGFEVSPTAAEFVTSIVTAICTAGGIVIGASATRHTGEGYAKAKAQVGTPPATRPGEEPYRG